MWPSMYRDWRSPDDRAGSLIVTAWSPAPPVIGRVGSSAKPKWLSGDAGGGCAGGWRPKRRSGSEGGGDPVDTGSQRVGSHLVQDGVGRSHDGVGQGLRSLLGLALQRPDHRWVVL